MGALKGSKNALGNKGGGRRSAINEDIRNKVINRSWDILNKDLDKKSVSEDEKRKIALEVAKKTIPRDFNIKGSLTISEVIKKLNNLDNG